MYSEFLCGVRYTVLDNSAGHKLKEREMKEVIKVLYKEV
jgi:hypothetical protein